MPALFMTRTLQFQEPPPMCMGPLAQENLDDDVHIVLVLGKADPAYAEDVGGSALWAASEC